MACTTEGTMDFESQLGGTLSDSTVKAEVDGDKLTLTTDDGHTVNLTTEKAAELYGTKWTVTCPATEERPTSLRQGRQPSADSLGCNSVTAKATVRDGHITLGRAGTTRKMCSASLMSTEKSLLKLFDSTVKYQVRAAPHADQRKRRGSRAVAAE